MAFPFTPVLDSGAGGDEDPITVGWSTPTISGDGALRRLTNRITCQAGGGASSSYRTTPTIADCEAYCTVSVVNTADEGLTLQLRLANPGTGGVDGYEIVLFNLSGTYFYARIDNGAETVLGAGVGGPILVAGDKLGLAMVNTTLVAYTKQGAGAWTPIDAGRTDATYPAGGNIGARISGDSGTSYHLTDFGGGGLEKTPVIGSVVLTGVAPIPRRGSIITPVTP